MMRKTLICLLFLAFFMPTGAFAASNYRDRVRSYLKDRYEVDAILTVMKKRWSRGGTVYKQTLSLDEREEFVREARKTLQDMAANLFYTRSARVVYIYNKDSTYWFIVELIYKSRGKERLKSRYLKGKLVAHPFSEKLRRAGNMMETHADFVVSAFDTDELTETEAKQLIIPYRSNGAFAEDYVFWRNSISTDIKTTENLWFGKMSPIKLMSSEKLYQKFIPRAREAIELAKIDNLTRQIQITGSENLANNLWRITFVSTDIYLDNEDNKQTGADLKQMVPSKPPVVKHWAAFLRLDKQTHKFEQGNYSLLMVSSYALKRDVHAEISVAPATETAPPALSPNEYKTPPDDNFDESPNRTNYVF